LLLRRVGEREIEVCHYTSFIFVAVAAGALDDCRAKNSLAAASFAVKPEKRLAFSEPIPILLAFDKPISCSKVVTGVFAIVIWLWVGDRELSKDFILEFS
jgi:hypothetical protein